MVNIVDKVSFKLAIADLVNIIQGDNAINIKEDTIMMNNPTNQNMEMAMEEMQKKAGIGELLKETKDAVIHGVISKTHKTKEQYVQQVDESANVVKGAMVVTLDKMSAVLGYNALKESILGIIEAGTCNGKTDLFAMAEECRKRIDLEVETLLAWGSEEDFRKAAQLKALSKDQRGKSIFEALVSMLIWIAKWVAKTLRKWFQVDNEKSIIGALCRALSGFAAVVREGVKLVWHTAKFGVSFVIAGAIKLGVWIINTFKTFCEGIKGWFNKKNEMIDDEEYQFFFVADEDGTLVMPE